MRRLLLLFILLTVLQAAPASAQANASIGVSDLTISYLFGQEIVVSAKLALPSSPTELYLLMRADGEATTRVFPITLDGENVTRFSYRFEQGPIRPFAIVRLWYRAKLQDGQQLDSEEITFRYEDNRIEWTTLEQESVRLHWYGRETPFGQSALDVTRLGLERIQNLLTVRPAAPIDVYIYASPADLQKTLEAGTLPGAGGHASPDLRLAVISILPGAEGKLELERKLPHELAHILTYDLTRERYERLPVWLREGLASRAELTPNPDYERAITLAAENQSIIPFTELCASFPPDSGRAFLAYAQSESFTRFIIEKYGQSGLLALMEAYGDGLDCEQGATRALGRSLTNLENDWRTAKTGASLNLAALGSLFPYLAILAVMLLVPITNALTFRRPKYDTP